MAVALVETHARGDEVLRRALSLAARLFLFAQQQSSEPPPVQIRVGLHCGEIQYLTDINDRPNVCGGAINHAQRVMDAANDGQCLISEDIQIKYLDRLDVYSFPIRGEQDGSAAFSGPLDVMVKHGRRATVRVAALKYEGRLISAPLDLAPVSKSQSVVTFTDLPKNIIVNDGFGSKLTKAKSICLIQLTGENLIRKLESGDVTFSSDIERLWVLMPSLDFIASSYGAPMPQMTVIGGYLERWKIYLSSLLRLRTRTDVYLGLFVEPPYFGASLLDWDRPTGTIHVSPYVWDTPARDCPGFDISWKDGRFPRVAQAYVDGLRYLKRTTKNIL